jgi:CheY-like chemotaxis protein
MIRDILPLIQAAIPRTVQLRLEGANEPAFVETDAVQIQQLLMNLVINGAEAIPESKPGLVTVSVAKVDIQGGRIGADRGLAPGRYLAIKVADTGSGMDEVTKSKIFDPFFTTKFVGRGLGLSAALGIVRRHRGVIDVRSVVGEGSVFRVLLPVMEDKAFAAGGDSGAPAARRAGSGTILVVDDEELVRQTARQALERSGYEALVAENGEAAIELFAARVAGVRLVLLDMTMPVMSGEETFARLREIRPDVPILVSSGFNEREAARRFGEHVLAGFLQKPYTAGTLIDRIQRALGDSAGA